MTTTSIQALDIQLPTFIAFLYPINWSNTTMGANARKLGFFQVFTGTNKYYLGQSHLARGRWDKLAIRALQPLEPKKGFCWIRYGELRGGAHKPEPFTYICWSNFNDGSNRFGKICNPHTTVTNIHLSLYGKEVDSPFPWPPPKTPGEWGQGNGGLNINEV